MRNLLIGGVGLLLSACASNPPEPLQPPAGVQAEQWPAVSIFRTRPSEEVVELCEERDGEIFFDCIRHDVDLTHYRSALESAGSFQAVEVANRDVPYSVSISVVRLQESDMKDMANAILAGGTLLLIPFRETADSVADVVVAWNGLELARYQYDVEYARSGGLLTGPGFKKADMRVANDVMSRLLVDASDDGVFEPEFVGRTLKASDYSAEWHPPERIGSFARTELVIFPHPFDGASYSYEHPTFADVTLDLFAYPIRETDWADASSILADEAERVRKIITLIAREADWPLPTFQPDQISSVDGRDVLCFDAMVSVTEQDQASSVTCLSIAEDKFVKLRMTGSQLVSHDELAQALANTRVPGESIFMAKVRLESD
ncbi:hypothetical protein [uncultured Abyssibacter sp.]|uniref:hypothetical protein n=1 Tax=uncultured Abyssibacter sp. TaxID=2320202 RepID=UPI0032B27E3E